MEAADSVGAVSKAVAFEYRDGLMIALLAAIPLRRRTFAALRIGKQLVKSGQNGLDKIGNGVGRGITKLAIGRAGTKRDRCLWLATASLTQLQIHYVSVAENVFDAEQSETGGLQLERNSARQTAKQKLSL